MSEPEDVILDGAHRATLLARGIWMRHSTGRQPNLVRLTEVRGRLELFVGAAFGVSLTLCPAEPPVSPNLFSRLGRRIPRHLVERRILTSTDGVRLRLPPSLPEIGGLLKYRLLASQAAARAARGTPEWLPAVLLERDLYLLSEAAAVDRQLAATLPGLLAALRAARYEARLVRPPSHLLTLRERAVEAELISTLENDPADGSGVGQ